MLRTALIAGLILAAPASGQTADLVPQAFEFETPDGVYIEEIPSVAVSADEERIYLFNRGRNALLVFDAEGRYLDEIGEGLFEKPHAVRIDANGNVWTADVESHLVIQFSADGEVLSVYGFRGQASPGWYDRGYNHLFLNEPSDVAFDRDGNLYIADSRNYRIVKFNADGELVGTFGEEGDGPGQFNFPHSLVVDTRGRLLVADRENQRIQVFSLDGEYITAWTDVGYPYMLALDPDGSVWATDARNEQILHLNARGEVLERLGGPGRQVGEYGFIHDVQPFAGGLLVTDILNWKIDFWAPEN